MSAALGFAAGLLAALALAELAGALAGASRASAPRALGGAESLLRAVLRAGREGHEPGALERRRLLAVGCVCCFLSGAVTFGPGTGLLLAAAGPWLAARLLRARRDHYRRAVEREAPALASALADALAGGHSLRGAIALAAPPLPGAAGHELRRVAAELAVGVRTDVALAALAARSRAHSVEVIVAACLLQARAGGDLAGMLRETADALTDEARLAADARAQTAQARFTAWLVAALPLGAGALAELASPGFVRALVATPLTASLLLVAATLQVVAWLAVRRLAAVSW